MKDIIVKPGSLWRALLPLVQKLRGWAWKFHNRTGIRLVISGGRIPFMDVELNFPEKVALTYATPLFWNGPEAYEAPTSRTIALLAGRSSAFFDVGSNVGIYAVYVGVRFPQVKVFAFEPVPVIWEKNQAFHRANGLPDQATYNLALSDRDTTQNLYFPIFKGGIDDEETATLNANSWQAHERKVEVIEIQCITLDTFTSRNHLPDGPCCIKIDVEGCEAAVLRGGEKFLKARRPWIICELLPCEEFDSVTRTKRNNNREALAELEKLGYAAFGITTDGYFRMNASDFARPHNIKDFLLVPSEKIDDATGYLAADTLAEIFSA